MASCHARAVMLRRKEYQDEIDYNIALTIANHMGSDGRPATVSISTIATYAHCHYNTADKRTKAMEEAGQLAIDRRGRFLAYSVPYDGDDGETEGVAAVSEIAEVRADVAELKGQVTSIKEQLAQLTAVVTQLSHDLHMTFTSSSHEVHMKFTPTDENGVNKVGKYGSSEELSPPEAEAKRTAEKPKTARQQAQFELEEHFVDVSGLPAPKQGTEKERKSKAVLWWNPLAEMWDQVDKQTEVAKQHITAVIAKMRQDGMNISSPGSILKVYQSRVAAEQWGKSNGVNQNGILRADVLAYVNGQKPFTEITPLAQEFIRAEGESNVKSQPFGVTQKRLNDFAAMRH